MKQPPAFPPRTRDLTRIALFVALMAACAWITVPLPAPLEPFTMQTFAVFAALLVLGGRRGTAAVTAYLLLGAAGAPVFSGFRGGAAVLLGVTGGYLLGFLVQALLYWLLTAQFGKPAQLTASLLGLAVCYAFGTAWFLFVYARDGTPIGLAAALGSCVLPFLLPDLLKLALALALAKRLGTYLSSGTG